MDIIKELLERAKEMPKAPERYVLFLEDASLKVTDMLYVLFKEGEFVPICEQYGYPAGALIVKDHIAFYVNELEGNGAKFKVFVEE